MEKTEGQDTDLRMREADARTDQRHKRAPRSLGEKRMRHELGQSSEYPVRTVLEDCYYYQKNGRCFFGRSCRFKHPPVSTEHKLRVHLPHDTVQPSAFQVHLGATNCEQYLQTGQCSYGRKCWLNHPPLPERNQMRHEMVQPSPYPVARDCEQYLQTGQCSDGRKCRFNHPSTHLAPVLPERVSRPICKYFQKGGCKLGSSFQYDNSVRGDDGVEPMRQATTWARRSDERRHETDSSSRAENRARTIPDDPRERFQDVSDDVVAGQNSWLQRRHAQENVKRGNIDCGQRRESEEERTPRERQAHDLEEQKQKNRKEETLRIDQVKAVVQSDESGIQTEQRLEIPENLQEQADMERENREAQEKAQEERSRSLTDNVDHLRQFLQGIGI